MNKVNSSEQAPDTPEEMNLGMYATGYKISDKDEVCFTSSGGGGFGDPLERDPNLVLRDVMNGYLSLEAAKDYYGVSISVIDEDMLDYSINEEETRSLREKLAKKPKKYGTGAFEINPQLKDLRISRELDEEEALRDCALVRPPGW